MSTTLILPKPHQNYPPIFFAEYRKNVGQYHKTVFPKHSTQQPGHKTVSETETICEEKIAYPHQENKTFEKVFIMLIKI